jgi:hypothetical protein
MKADEITELYRRKVAIGEGITIARMEVKRALSLMLVIRMKRWCSCSKAVGAGTYRVAM